MDTKNIIDEKSLEKKIDSLEKMVNALSSDRDKKAMILANKIKSRLQIEYTDFMDAVDIPMTVELGENMREQLKNIFRALERLGINFN